MRISSFMIIAAAVVVLGCKDLTGNPGLPAGTPNPTFYNNFAGAIGMRNAAMWQVEQALPQYIIDSGLLTDELEDIKTGASQGTLLQNGATVSDPLDERILPTGVIVASYSQLQAVRTFAQQALGALAHYDTTTATLDSAKIMRGELYAIEGYAEIMLADLFCSGIPLSYLIYQGDFQYAPSSTTQQVYDDALAKFDTALTLAGTSDSLMYLARVGQGRAYLDLGEYAAAADDVSSVPDGFLYQFTLQWENSTGIQYNSSSNRLNGSGTISNDEGRNGLPFLTSDDPRTAADTVVQANPSSGGPYVPLTFPVKYSAGLSGSGYAPFTVASGTEARLIQAEAQLHGVTTGHGSWIDKLNALRTAAGLGTIADPGAATVAEQTAQIDTLFTERAYWLFLDGHRQGDLRRLLRNYSQYQAFNSQAKVYPTGQYLAPGTNVYGTDVTAPIPLTEDANPNFHGCISTNP